MNEKVLSLGITALVVLAVPGLRPGVVSGQQQEQSFTLRS